MSIVITEGAVREATASIRDGIRDVGRFLTETNEEKLILFCRKRNLEGVKSVLKKNPDVNVKDEYGRTPLIIASSAGENDSVNSENFHLICLLLEHGGVEIEAKDHYGNTALIMASRNGAEGIVWKLMEEGADANAQNRIGWTGLMRAVNHGYHVTALTLLLKGADQDIKNDDGDKAIDILHKNPKSMKKFAGTKALDILEGRITL